MAVGYSPIGNKERLSPARIALITGFLGLNLAFWFLAIKVVSYVGLHAAH